MGQGERVNSLLNAGIQLKCLSFGRKPWTGYATNDIHVCICILKMPFHLQDCLCRLPHPCIQGLSGKLLSSLRLWVLPYKKAAIGEFQRSKWGATLCFIVGLLHATFNLKCKQNKLLASERKRGEEKLFPYILKSIYFRKPTHIPLCPNWYLLIMCTTQGVLLF